MQCYGLRGNMENVALYPCVPYVERPEEEHFVFLPEINAVEAGVREFPTRLPAWWCLYAEADEDKRFKFRFDDAISSTDGFFGVDNFVSESAVDRLEPHLRHECEFHPIKIEGAPEPYYALWIKDHIPAVDLSKAQVRQVEYNIRNGQRTLRLLTYEFLPELVEDRFLFRLTGGQIDEGSLVDYATERFVSLVTKLSITGFHFYKARSDFKALVPVRHRK